MNTSSKSSPIPNQITPGAYEKTVTLKYRWRCDSFPNGIPPRLREALDESAEKRAGKMREDGCCEGELIDYVNMKIPGVKTPEDGFYCKGWFEFIES